MLLNDKNAVVYGGGAIGGAVARAFAREGARVFLAGRNRSKLEAIADDILASGGQADVAVLDALDPQAVAEHADAVVEAAGSLDISFNLISVNDIQGTPLVEMSVDDFMSPIVTALRSSFLTQQAAARHMIASGRGGVILNFGGSGPPLRDYSIGGFQIALEGVEALRRQLSTEAGKHGVRVITLRTGGVIDSIPDDFKGRDALVESLEAMTLTGRGARLADVAEVAAFVASDRARTMTAATVNVSAGALLD